MAFSPKYVFALMACLSLTWVGCCGVQCQSPCGGGLMLNPGPACGSSCSTGSCGNSDTCSSGGCQSGCGSDNACPGLLHGEIARRIRSAIVGGCCVGCGEYYCDEQVNEPPTCDPCGCNGQFTGDNPGPCQPLWQRMKKYMGTPYRGNCGCEPCHTGCGHDAYASNHQSGYCSSCRDGVAGMPAKHALPTTATRASQPASSTPVKTEGSEPSEMNASETAPSRLQPTPDPLSQSPRRPKPQTAGRVVVSQSR
jgi:hypothetical protein